MEEAGKEVTSSSRSSVDPTTTASRTEEPTNKRKRFDDDDGGDDDLIVNKKNPTTSSSNTTTTESQTSSSLLKSPPQQQPSQPKPPNWRIWKAIDRLEERQDIFYPSVTRQVIEILKELGNKYTGDVKWKSFLDKRRIYNEIEESIIAIHYLLEGTSATTASDNTKYIAVDVCGGKGYFSFLLSYINPRNLHSIILLEKATDIDWYHIYQSNDDATKMATDSAKRSRRPHIDIWKDCNLHDYDVVLDKFLQLNYPVALTGIHLCKQLSPSFIGLVNGLGRDRCIYSCLAPCCLPRVITSQKYKKDTKDKANKSYTISIQKYETQDERNRRLDYVARRERIKYKPKGGPCYVCQHPDHNLRDCNVFPTLPKDKQVELAQSWHAATVPCWNCFQFGHYKSNCPNTSSSVDSQQQHLPPMICLDVSNLLQSSENPYKSYCHLLANEGFQFQQQQQQQEQQNSNATTASATASNNNNITVVETELTDNNNHDSNNGKKQKGQKMNNRDWNSDRKSIFIISKKMGDVHTSTSRH